MSAQSGGEHWSDVLEGLRSNGWSVAVHNDYQILQQQHTFWLLTHPDGRWVKGEGRTDLAALQQIVDNLVAATPNEGEGE